MIDGIYCLVDAAVANEEVIISVPACEALTS
jgi:hypothetical protein